MALTAAEVEHFAVNGYLVKEGLLDSAQCQRARDMVWELNDLSRLRRNEPESWAQPFSVDEESPKEVEGKDLDTHLENDRPVMSRKGYGFYMSGLDTQACPELLELLPLNAGVKAVAEALLGKGRFITPDEASAADALAQAHASPGKEVFNTGHGTRGIYCTLPRVGAAADTDQPCEAGARGGPPRGGHWDSIFAAENAPPNCLMASAYINDVPPGGGGLTLWPGSHRRNWHYHSSLFKVGVPHPKERQAPNGDGINDLANKIMEDIAPTECIGSAGTVVFWHVCVLHAAGINRVPNTIRQSVIYDFQLTAQARQKLLDEARSPARAIGDLDTAEEEAASFWAGWQVPATVLRRHPIPGQPLPPGHPPVLHPRWEQHGSGGSGAKL